MKEFIRCIYLFSSCCLLVSLAFYSCTEHQSDGLIAEKQEGHYTNINIDLETLCLFAASDIDRRLGYAKSKQALLDAHFLNVAAAVSQQIGRNENPERAKALLLQYLESTTGAEEIQALGLGAHFKAKRIDNLHKAKNQTELLSSIMEIIQRFTYCDIAETTYRRFYTVNRVPYFNGDTLQLKRNKVYRFPTMLYINNSFVDSKYKFQELEPLWINTAELTGTFDSMTLAIKTHNGVATVQTKSKLYVELME